MNTPFKSDNSSVTALSPAPPTTPPNSDRRSRDTYTTASNSPLPKSLRNQAWDALQPIHDRLLALKVKFPFEALERRYSVYALKLELIKIGDCISAAAKEDGRLEGFMWEHVGRHWPTLNDAEWLRAQYEEKGDQLRAFVPEADARAASPTASAPTTFAPGPKPTKHGQREATFETMQHLGKRDVSGKVLANSPSLKPARTLPFPKDAKLSSPGEEEGTASTYIEPLPMTIARLAAAELEENDEADKDEDDDSTIITEGLILVNEIPDADGHMFEDWFIMPESEAEDIRKNGKPLGVIRTIVRDTKKAWSGKKYV